MHTSYSALDTYKTCPRKYKYQEIDKIKTPKKLEQVFGTIIHSALKFMFERNPLYPTIDEIVDFYSKAWGETAVKIAWVSESEKERKEKIYFEEGLKMLKNFYKKNSPWNFNPVELESRFMVEVLDEENGNKHTLGGIMDRLDKDPSSDFYEIIDYKTSKKMPPEDSLADNLQLGLYALAVKKRWPSLKDEQIKLSLYFLKHNEKISIAASPENLDRVKRRILTTVKEIEKRLETGDFTPLPGPLCDYCGYRNICPMWSHEYKKGEAATLDETVASAAIKEFFEIKETDEKNKKRLAELRNTILSYMENEKIERVFGGDGYITKTVQERFSFDMDKIKPILERLGKWVDILGPDEDKLEEILAGLPEKEAEEILATRDKKTFITLKQTKSKNT